MQQTTERKITDPKKALFLFILCWIAYFTCYIGRLDFSSAMTAMIGEGVLTKTQAGTVTMVYFFVYGAGQMLNGFLGDRAQPEGMILGGLALSALCNFAMGLINGCGMMMLVWGVNGYAQSMVWPPIIRIFASRFDEKTCLRCSVDIVTTHAAGTLAAYVLSALVLAVADWRAVFRAAGACLLAAGTAWVLGCAHLRRVTGLPAERPRRDAAEEKAPAGQDGGRFASLLAGGLWIFILPVVVHGILKDGVTSWVPTFIQEAFRLSASLSVLVTTVLPVVNLFGAYFAKALYSRNGEDEIKAASVLFALSAAALTVLLLAGSVSLVLTVAMLALITMAMMGANTLFVSLTPLRFEKEGRVSTVSGFLNACAYVGTAVSTFTIGVMVERLGWGWTMAGWLAVAVAGLAGCLAVRRLFRRRYKTGETHSGDSGA